MDPDTAPDSDESVPMLPGFGELAQNDGKPGFLEEATLRTIKARSEDGWLGPGDSGPVALALITARKVDRMSHRDAASGQANLLRAMKEVFEMLPQPEVAGSSDLKAVLEVVQAEEQEALTA
ncbi:hypothetical protein CVCC1112_2631 [Paenarthrobacter nicotinovorans]|uniref:hypothetical protein n=1 Tax=Paenarthrobacter nicotinovorans TaxID=29320 RepID=UPI0007CCF51D|nr:hypothetical protein [Paenarthrobacter nicotinovorans]GAT87972.1 hypothetical protein CVCC1112_2631 [Paenarthrobacter nicotinovorans]